MPSGFSANASSAGVRAGTTVIPFQRQFRREMETLMQLARDRGISTQPVVRDRLTRAWIGLRLMEWNNDRLQGAVMRGEHPGPESSLGKLIWANWHRDFGELTMNVRGAGVIASERPVLDDPMVHTFLNSRAETIYGGANEIQRNIIGERVLGLPPEPRPPA